MNPEMMKNAQNYYEEDNYGFNDQSIKRLPGDNIQKNRISD